MVKKMISRLSVLAVLIVFLAACSKTSEYTNVIPADASVVASIGSTEEWNERRYFPTIGEDYEKPQ